MSDPRCGYEKTLGARTARPMDRLLPRVACGLLIAATSAALPGCGNPEIERILLTGDVTFDGQIVERGEIRFIPEPGVQAPQTITLIRDGRYDTSPSAGVPVGAHRIEIKGYKAAEYDTIRPGPFAPPANQILPDKYNAKSTLKLQLSPGSDSSQDVPFRLAP